MRIFIYTCVALLIVILQSSVLNILLPKGTSPDLMAIFVVYISITRRFKRTIATSLLCAYLTSLHSSAGFYVVAISFIIMLIVSKYITINLDTGKLRYFFLSIFLPVFMGKLFFIIWLGSLRGIFYDHLLYILSESVVTSLTAYLLFKLFHYIDVRTNFINYEVVKSS